MGYSHPLDSAQDRKLSMRPARGAWVKVSSASRIEGFAPRCAPHGAHGLQWVHRDRGIKQIMMRPARGRMGYSINIALF